MAIYFCGMVSIVRMAANEAPLLSEIGKRSLLESHGHSAPATVMQAYVIKAFSLAACQAELLDEQNLFHVIYYNGQPAGYSKIVFHCAHSAVAIQPVTKLERLYLLKEFYGRKLGHYLLENTIALSTAAGEKGMWLNVWKKNERALQFYAKQGFAVVGESEFVLTEIHANPNWVMWLSYQAE